MTATPVDHVTEAAPPLALPHPSRWAYMRESLTRRRWTAVLAAALVITAIGVGILYTDDQNNQATIRNLQIQNESLTGRNQIVMDQLKTTQANLTATLGELATTKGELEHPHLVIWNYPQKIPDRGAYLAGGIPDTFTYHLEATSTGPMDVSILTLEQFVKAVDCTAYAVTDYCMHHNGADQSWLGVTSVKFDFHKAEGCADYVAVFTAPGAVTVTPNVSVTYNPASNVTGACA